MKDKQHQYEQYASDLELLAADTDTNTQYELLNASARAMREAALGHARYEALRCLNPREYTEMWRCNLAGGRRFDDMVDELVKAKNEPK